MPTDFPLSSGIADNKVSPLEANSHQGALPFVGAKGQGVKISLVRDGVVFPDGVGMKDSDGPKVSLGWF